MNARPLSASMSLGAARWTLLVVLVLQMMNAQVAAQPTLQSANLQVGALQASAQPAPDAPQVSLSLPESPLLVVGSTPLWISTSASAATRNTVLPTEDAFRELYAGRADLVLGTLPPPLSPAGTDHPLSVPVGVFAVSVAYRLPGVNLRLDLPTLCRLLSGQISRWNAPEVAKLNPGAALPALPVLISARTARNGVSLAVAGACVNAGIWPASQLKANWSGGASFGRATLGAMRTDLNIPGTLAVFALQSTPPGSQVAAMQAAGGSFVAGRSELGLRAEGVGGGSLAEVNLPSQPFGVLPASDEPGAYPLRGLIWASVMPEQAYRGRSLERARALLQLIGTLRSSKGRGFSGLPEFLWPDAARTDASEPVPGLMYQGQPVIVPAE